jgi:glutaredoxin
MDKKAIIFLFLICLFIGSLFINEEDLSGSTKTDLMSLGLPTDCQIDVYFFYGEGCPHCAVASPFLAKMESKYPIQLHSYDIYTNREHISLFNEYLDKYEVKTEDRAVPAVFISDSYFVGSGSILNGFERVVKNVMQESSTKDTSLDTGTQTGQIEASEAGTQYIPILTITVSALVDAISPCSLAILVFLIGARVLVSDFKKRALKVGLAFCLSIFIGYFLFGIGILNAIVSSGLSGIFSLLVGLIALSVGLLYLKDVFCYRRGGFAMEVPNSLKPAMHRRSLPLYSWPAC